MSFEEIYNWLVAEFGHEVIKGEAPNCSPRTIEVEGRDIATICGRLKHNPHTFFDFLSCLTGIDNGPEADSMEVVYHLYSIPMGHALALKATIPRSTPVVPTVSTVWRTADWHEREAFDLFGIQFQGHPDLRRILLPTDWEGHPLRKDYSEQQRYHGIEVKY